MKVLVTGATGFLGKWMCQKLHSEGLDVRILKRRGTPVSSFFNFPIEVCEGDITQADAVENACRDADAVFHLAGLVAYKPDERALMEKVNVGGTENVLAACIKHRVRRLVNMSSVVAVGASIDGRHPLNENSEFNLHPFNFGYFETKLKAEQIVLNSARGGQIDALCINPSTIYGAGDFEKDSRRTQLKVAQGRMPFYTKGGVSVVAVEDVVECTFRAWQKGQSGERYIISGENLLIKDLFKLIADAAGVKAPQLCLPNFAVHTLGAIGDVAAKMGVKFPLNSEAAGVATLFHWFDASKAKKAFDIQTRPAHEAIRNSVQAMLEKKSTRD